MTSFMKIRLMILLVYLVSVSTMDEFKSDIRIQVDLHNRVESENQNLPTLCPSTKQKKALCPTINRHKDEIQLVKGENAFFECRVSKILGPKPHYVIRMWWCNGTMGRQCYEDEQAPDRTPRTYFAYNQSAYNADECAVAFNITNATSSDENTYTCVANTEDRDYTRTPGYSSIRVSVNEAKKPILTNQPPKYIYQHVGKLMELYCGSEGYPDPVIRWVKDGVPLDKNASNAIQYGRHSVLRISNISENDAGMYQCIAVNQVDFIESEGTHVEVRRKVWIWQFCVCVITGFLTGVLVSIFCCYFRYNGGGKGKFGIVDGRKRTRSNSSQYSPLSLSDVC
ncbi:hemicentin-1-like isoform X2 [Anneissia japonica]|uniref:hemicentin-1-like isoform X2 n=1 Tax=Anneissia japonica TaxID=1529436 RepID=UPI0014254D92|nr:hemicentin-1-like isoform X2 [Anneissia japonica]